MDVARPKELAAQEIDQVAGRLVAISRELYANPELAFEERQACRVLTLELEGNGFTVKRGIAGLPTAFWASYGGPSNGFVVAFLAEYDALPSIGHACGHNLIAAAALGAAIGVSQVMHHLDGRVVAIGTPAEETGGGKAILVEAGVFDEVDFALLAHPYSSTVITRPSLAMKTVQVDFYGKTSHASVAPEKGRNALEGVIATFVNINGLRQYMRSDARIHGIITDGGSAVNMIPDHASAVFSVRATSREYATELLKRVKDCVQAATLATSTKAEIRLLASYDNFVPNHAFARALAANLERVGVDVRDPIDGEGLASTDVGNVSHVVPTINAYFQIGTDIVQHTPEFAEAAVSRQGEHAMIQVAKAMAMTAIDVLTDTRLADEIREEFVSQHRGT